MNIESVREIFSVDIDKGIVTVEHDYKKWKSGDVIHPLPDAGKYKLLCVEGALVSLHRLIWMLSVGEIPRGFVIDHINGDSRDNRLINLRLCTQSENAKNRKVNKNNSCGMKGVYLDPTRGRGKVWRSQIRVSGKKISLGSFSSPYEAHLAYKKAELKYFGEFKRN